MNKGNNTVKMKCRCCGAKERFVVTPNMRHNLFGNNPEIRIKYTCYNCEIFGDLIKRADDAEQKRERNH